MAARKALPYKEGDWIAVPLPECGYALGRIARVQSGGIMLVYFSRHYFEAVPTHVELPGFAAEDAVFVGKLGTFQVLQGNWQVIRGSGSFERSEWPVPKFGHIEPLTGRAYRITYSDSDLLQPVSRERCSPEEVARLPEDCLHGWGVLPVVLARLVGFSAR